MTESDWNGRRTRLAGAFDTFLAAAEQLPPAVRDRPGADDWSPRDVVCHVSAWAAEGLSRLRAFRADPALPDRTYDVDAFNAAAVAARRDLDWDAALAESRRVHGELDAFLSTVTAEELAASGGYAEWTDGLADHLLEHAAELGNRRVGPTPQSREP